MPTIPSEEAFGWIPAGCLADCWSGGAKPDRLIALRGRKVAIGLTERSEKAARSEFREKLVEAFLQAYPDIPEDEAKHSARNLAQVISGVVDIGDRTAADEITHMDAANAFVYWCVANTELETFFKGTNNGSDGARGSVANGQLMHDWEEMEELLDGFVARAADMLIGMQVLSENLDLYRAFIRGSAVIGAYHREKNRAEIRY